MSKPVPAGPVPRRRFRRWFLISLKWCRISFLLLCLVVIVLGLFLNHVGLPDWLNHRVEEQFRAKGWDVQYSRLRLRWYHGIVAEDLQLQRTNALRGPSLFLPRAEFRLNWQAFRQLQLEANSALLQGGRLVWPLPGTNQPRRTLLLSNLGGELQFLPHDIWDLRYLQADVLGTRVQFRGEITNASFIREWRLPERPRPPDEIRTPGDFWTRFLAKAQQLRFEGQPEFRVVFSGDAQNWKSFEGQARFTGTGVASPWASGSNLSLAAHVLPSPRSNDPVRVDVRLTADQAQTLWGAATNLDLNLVFEPSFTQLLPTNTLALLELRGASNRWCRAERVVLELRCSPTPTNNTFNLTSMDLSLDQLQSPALQLEAGQTRVTATSLHPATNMLPAAVDSLWTVQQAKSRWATSSWAQIRAKAEVPVPAAWHFADTNRTWPERFEHLALNIRSSFSNVIAPHLQATHSTLSLLWRDPLLELTAGTDMPEAMARFESTLHTDLRELRFRTEGRVPPQLLSPFLGTNAQRWLRLCRFEAPPTMDVSGRLGLPPWNQPIIDWNKDILPTAQAAGRLRLEAGELLGVRWESAQIPFALTNLNWTVPNLKVARQEGALQVNGKVDQRTGQFEATVRSDVNWMALRTAFPATNAQRVFNQFNVQLPPVLNGVASGNYNDWSQLQGRFQVALTNFAYREQAVRACTTELVYANQFLSILRPRIWRDNDEQAQADGIGIDLVDRRLFLTNAVGQLATRAVTRCIGPQTDRAVAPYVFDRPPYARVEGVVPLGRSDGTENMRFDIDGGPFHWQRFNLERIKAHLVWRGNSLALTNVIGRWHGADMAGWANFDFSPRNTDLFNFFVRLENADLRRVLRDLQQGRNSKVEGTISGELRVTSADTHDWLSWQGYGHAFLTNGLLWDTPVFSMFSPILNAFVPGLGNSRARHATATYQITNSVIYSDDLVIRGTALRMNYKGAVDFEKRLEGRMEAELLRDLPAFGFLFSKLLWPVTKLFDYKVTGTLDQPKMQELYMLSRLITMPLHPIKTLKDLMNLEEKPETKPDGKPPSPPPNP